MFGNKYNPATPAEELAALKKKCLKKNGEPRADADEVDLIRLAEIEGILDEQTEEPEPTAEEPAAELDGISKTRPKKWVRAACRVMRDFANGVPEDKRYGILGDCVKESADLIERSKAILGS